MRKKHRKKWENTQGYFFTLLYFIYIVEYISLLTCKFFSFKILQQPQIILLKEGTDATQGKQQVISNINACQIVVDAVRTTLGPRGMDKLIVDQNGKSTISNDGATILKLLDIIHPAAKTLVDIAKSQDAEVRIIPSLLMLFLTL